MALLIASPRPVPGMACRVTVAVRKKRSKTRLRSVSAMPMPVSATASTALSPSTPSLTSTRPPSGVNFTALESRLSSNWEARTGSKVKRGTSVADSRRSMCLRSASGRCCATAYAATSARSALRNSIDSCPELMPDRNSRSPTSRISRCALRSMTARNCPESRPRARSSSSSSA